MSTKNELREEIAELRNTGSLMSNVLFNLAQGVQADEPLRQLADELRRGWDGIPRRERFALPDSTRADIAKRRREGRK